MLILSCDPDEAKKKPPNTQNQNDNQTNEPKTIKATKIAKIPKVVSLDAVSSKTAGNDGGTDASNTGWVLQGKEITFKTKAKDKDGNEIANAKFVWQWRKRGKEKPSSFGHTWTPIKGQTTASATLPIDAKERVGAYELRVSAISGGEEAKSKTPYKFTVRKYGCPPPDSQNAPADPEELLKKLNVGNLAAMDISKFTNLDSLFLGRSRFNGEINCWDASNVTNMENLFTNASEFNQNIADWDTSSVTNMEGMFTNAVKFNQDISQWDTSSVINMAAMFGVALEFNQDLSGWNVSNVKYKDNFAIGTLAWTKPKPWP